MLCVDLLLSSIGPMRWVGVDGWTVEAVVLNGRQLLRVRHLGYHVAYCGSVREVAQHLDLADLVEVIPLPARPS